MHRGTPEPIEGRCPDTRAGHVDTGTHIAGEPSDECHQHHRGPKHPPPQTVAVANRLVIGAVVRSARVPDVVLPVLDEAGALPGLLAALPAGFRPIVVDNGSTDGSAGIARSFGALVVDEPRRGFGAACWAGLQAADADIVCFMDADGSLDPADLVRVVEPINANHADLVLGARVAERGAWPLHARIANRTLARRLGRSLDLPLRDVGPMRAARRLDLLALGITDRRFGWPLEMVVLASQAGWRIDEIDVPYLARIGRSKVTGTVRGTLRAVGDMRAVLRRTGV